jgi:hypothetical protein
MLVLLQVVTDCGNGATAGRRPGDNSFAEPTTFGEAEPRLPRVVEGPLRALDRDNAAPTAV